MTNYARVIATYKVQELILKARQATAIMEKWGRVAFSHRSDQVHFKPYPSHGAVEMLPLLWNFFLQEAPTI